MPIKAWITGSSPVMTIGGGGSSRTLQPNFAQPDGRGLDPAIHVPNTALAGGEKPDHRVKPDGSGRRRRVQVNFVISTQQLSY
jgi:hypothetical protein